MCRKWVDKQQTSTILTTACPQSWSVAPGAAASRMLWPELLGPQDTCTPLSTMHLAHKQPSGSLLTTRSATSSPHKSATYRLTGSRTPCMVTQMLCSWMCRGHGRCESLSVGRQLVCG